MESIDLAPLNLDTVGDPTGSGVWSAPFVLVDALFGREEPYLYDLLAPCSKRFGAAFVSGIDSRAMPNACRLVGGKSRDFIREFKDILRFQQWADEARSPNAPPVYTLVVLGSPLKSLWPHILELQSHAHITVVCISNLFVHVPTDVALATDVFISQLQHNLTSKRRLWDEVFDSTRLASIQECDKLQLYCEHRNSALVCIRGSIPNQLAFFTRASSSSFWPTSAWPLAYQPIECMFDEASVYDDAADGLFTATSRVLLGQEQIVWLFRRGLLRRTPTPQETTWIKAWEYSQRTFMKKLLACTPLPTVLCEWIAKEF
jgi:hypothetical protein